MAVNNTPYEFIREIAPYICYHARANGYKYPSAIIAQACLESGYGKSKLSQNDHNYFGMKAGSKYTGNTASYKTKEEYKEGKLTTISARFRSYNNMDEGVQGYFAFIGGYSRYSNLKLATSSEDYITKIKNDGWATSYKYIENLKRILYTYDLKKYDEYANNDATYIDIPEQYITKTVSDIFIEETALKVIQGKYGSGEERKKKIGRYYDDIQAKVNELLKGKG